MAEEAHAVVDTDQRQWSLGLKLALVLLPFLVFTGVSIGVTLWVSWQLDGGAAAVNEAGRLRMQINRMARAVDAGDATLLRQYVTEFDASIELLRVGDTHRPLFVPWDARVRERFTAVEAEWADFRVRWGTPQSLQASATALEQDTARFTDHIDALVRAIERHMSRWTAIMHLVQMALLAFAVLASATLVYTGYVFVLEPVSALARAVRRVQQGDLGARVGCASRDEFGALAEGFNGMAEHLQSVYDNLETRVHEKTAELEEKHERLEALYEVAAIVADAASTEELAHGFVRCVLRLTRADGALLRWYDTGRGHYVPLAWDGLPQAMIAAESTLAEGECACGVSASSQGVREPELRLVALDALPASCLQHCRQAGFATAVTVPVRVHQHTSGELDLFFRSRTALSVAERSLLEALAAHLAAGLENIRLAALAKEAAVAEERGFIARELHDSIAQSLAYLKIQVQLMRDALAAGDAGRIAAVLADIDTGVRESYGDVRELLLHFRTRADAGGIETALQTTLGKFEHQSGLHGELRVHGHAMPLPPDVQIQVLHIVQEALSNVRKHARASRVRVEVWKQPAWCFEISDDGIGFADGAVAVDALPADATHVGLRIMAERAARIGAELAVDSWCGKGTRVRLDLPLAGAVDKTTDADSIGPPATTEAQT